MKCAVFFSKANKSASVHQRLFTLHCSDLIAHWPLLNRIEAVGVQENTDFNMPGKFNNRILLQFVIFVEILACNRYPPSNTLFFGLSTRTFHSPWDIKSTITWITRRSIYTLSSRWSLEQSFHKLNAVEKRGGWRGR